MDDFYEYVKEHNRQIESTARSIQYLNQEYQVKDIKAMVWTAIWEELHEEKPITMKGIGYTVLKRVLEEKGVKYNKGELLKPVSIIDTMPFISSSPPKDYTSILKDMFSLCKLTQEEMVVLVLCYGLESTSLKGQYKEIVDQLRNNCNYNPLTYFQISKLLSRDKKIINKIHTTAWRKLNAARRYSRTSAN
jgi:hypothetical protein